MIQCYFNNDFKKTFVVRWWVDCLTPLSSGYLQLMSSMNAPIESSWLMEDAIQISLTT